MRTRKSCGTNSVAMATRFVIPRASRHRIHASIIASLHGAAAAGATLAHLGGGSVAAGGLGIAGGVAALGTTFAVPAIAAGGYLWDKSVRQQHLKVVAYEKAVDEECRILQQIYRRYDALHMKLINWLAREQYNRRIKGGAE